MLFMETHSLENELATMTFAIEGFVPYVSIAVSRQADMSLKQDPLGGRVDNSRDGEAMDVFRSVYCCHGNPHLCKQ